jgi:hypothetical protein
VSVGPKAPLPTSVVSVVAVTRESEAPIRQIAKTPTFPASRLQRGLARGRLDSYQPPF